MVYRQNYHKGSTMRAETDGLSNMEWLYGIKQSTWSELSYLDALLVKRNLADNLIKLLFSVHYLHRNNIRIKDCTKARDLADEMLLE